MESNGKFIGEILGIILKIGFFLIRNIFTFFSYCIQQIVKLVAGNNRQGKEALSDTVQKYCLSLELSNRGGVVNINNPYRGIVIVGGAGSGKSESIIKPLLWQAMGKKFCGIVYDFKDPELSLEACSAFNAYNPNTAEGKIRFARLSFTDINTSNRCNPLAPKYIPTLSHAEEYATAIINNLMPESIRKPDFWNRSAVALLQAAIWFMKEERPEFCTLPHVVNFLQSPIKDVIGTLQKSRTCSKLISSMITAYEQNAQGQLAGTIGTLQLALNKINTPEIAFLLSKDEINLDLNNTENPTLLTIGNNPTLQDSLSPVISLVITVCLKMMNAPNKHHSIVVLDEAPTIYIPKLETVPATARSNKIAVVFCCQDFSQVVDNYGTQKKDALVANLANQFYGRVNHLETSNYMIKLAGREEVWQQSYSYSENKKEFLGTPHKTTSTALREKDNLRIQNIQAFQPGQFLTILVERGQLKNRFGAAHTRQLSGLFIGQYKTADPARDVYTGFEPYYEQHPDVNAAQATVHEEIERLIEGYSHSGRSSADGQANQEYTSLLDD
jgi:hypothetical protein